MSQDKKTTLEETILFQMREGNSKMGEVLQGIAGITGRIETISTTIMQFMLDMRSRMNNIERNVEVIEKRVEKGESLDKMQTISILVGGVLIFILFIIK